MAEEKKVYFSHHCGRSEDFALIDRLARSRTARDWDEETIFEQIGRNPPEPVAIWQKSA